MPMGLLHQVRIEQTSLNYLYLLKEIDDWLGECRGADDRRQYETQLLVLEGVLKRALTRLQSSLADETQSISAAEVYGKCRTYDEYLVWVRRVWNYFKSKFDQRKDGTTCKVLAAADEVVWSCYAGAFRNAASDKYGVVRGTAPLPYIDDFYSAHATTRDAPPTDLQSAEVDRQTLERLQAYLDKLPIPIITLPPYTIKSPWWLALLAHEVGHQVQSDLLPDSRLEAAFGEFLGAGVRGGGEPRGEQAEANRWAAWGNEIFADAFSVFNLGPAAVWVIGELELADEETMLTPGFTYPSPLARLHLMSRVAEAAGAPAAHPTPAADAGAWLAASPLKRLKPAAWRQASDDLRMASKLAPLICETELQDLVTFGVLCDWDPERFAPRGSVDNWKEALLGREPLEPEFTLSAARWIVAGAVAAWAELATTVEDHGRRRERQEQLAARTLSMLRESREEDTRSAEEEPAGGQAEGLGLELADLLLATNEGV